MCLFVIYVIFFYEVSIQVILKLDSKKLILFLDANPVSYLCVIFFSQPVACLFS